MSPVNKTDSLFRIGGQSTWRSCPSARRRPEANSGSNSFRQLFQKARQFFCDNHKNDLAYKRTVAMKKSYRWNCHPVPVAKFPVIVDVVGNEGGAAVGCWGPTQRDGRTRRARDGQSRWSWRHTIVPAHCNDNNKNNNLWTKSTVGDFCWVLK